MEPELTISEMTAIEDLMVAAEDFAARMAGNKKLTQVVTAASGLWSQLSDFMETGHIYGRF